MPRFAWRIPLAIQVGAVVAVFAAALILLWSTWASVIERERQRSAAKDSLDAAGKALAARGSSVLATSTLPNSFDYLDAKDRALLARRLADEAVTALAKFPGVEGGYFLRDYRPGAASPSSAPPDPADLVEIQADAAIRKNRILYVIEAALPVAVAIQTAPVVVEGRPVAATWAMVRLAEPIFGYPSGYSFAAGLALGGIALSLVLMAGLARTIRRQRIERDRLQAELRRSERLAALGKLLAGVAHEVRNPLAGIRSTVQLWQRGIGPDDESFADLVAEADRLEGIVARLLHFTRADAQDLTLGDVNAVLADVAKVARGQAQAEGVQIELDLEPDLPMVWMAAPALLQVFRNLVANAVQAMPDGGTIRLASRTDAARGAIDIMVSDTGPGLSADVLAHLFEPFFTTKAGGTGLGLAIAREIALAHRGEIRAESRRDGATGAVFTLTLPIAKEPKHEEPVNATQRAGAGDRRR
jgi:signal transduction histidine kinase